MSDQDNLMSDDQEQQSNEDDADQTPIAKVPSQHDTITAEVIETEITDEWGYKSVWNQTLQEMALKTQCIYLFIAIVLLNLKPEYGGLYLIKLAQTQNIVIYTSLLFTLSILPQQFFPQKIQEVFIIIIKNLVRCILFLIYSVCKPLLLILLGVALKSYHIIQFYLLLLCCYLYLLYILKSQFQRSGMNTYKVEDYYLQMTTFILILTMIVVLTTKLNFIYFLVFYTINMLYSFFVMLQSQLTQRRISLTFKNNHIYMAGTFIDSDLIFPCFMISYTKIKKFKQNEEEELPIEEIPIVVLRRSDNSESENSDEQSETSV